MTIDEGSCTCAAGYARNLLASPAEAAGMPVSEAAVTTVLASRQPPAAREPRAAA